MPKLKKKKVLIPTEYEEAKVFCDWLNYNRYRFSHIQNEQSNSGNWGAIMKSKRLGVKPGVPDYIICGKNRSVLIFVELKRIKGFKLRKEQTDWILAIKNTGNEASYCFGAEKAVEFVKSVDK